MTESVESKHLTEIPEGQPLSTERHIFLGSVLPTMTTLVLAHYYFFTHLKIDDAAAHAIFLIAAIGLVLGWVIFVSFVVIVAGIRSAFVPWKHWWTALLGGFAITFTAAGVCFVAKALIVQYMRTP